MSKTLGMDDVLADALEPLRKKINLTFLYGSVARSREEHGGGVDLMIVGDVDFDEVAENLWEFEKTLHREINPALFTAREFHKKETGNFLQNVLKRRNCSSSVTKMTLENRAKHGWLERLAVIFL